MRQRGLRSGETGHVERERLGPVGPHQPFEAQREVGLGEARADVGQERGERAIRDRTGRCDPLDLGRFLDRSVGLDPALDRNELDGGCRGRQTRPDSL